MCALTKRSNVLLLKNKLRTTLHVSNAGSFTDYIKCQRVLEIYSMVLLIVVSMLSLARISIDYKSIDHRADNFPGILIFKHTAVSYAVTWYLLWLLKQSNVFHSEGFCLNQFSMSYLQLQATFSFISNDQLQTELLNE